MLKCAYTSIYNAVCKYRQTTFVYMFEMLYTFDEIHLLRISFHCLCHWHVMWIVVYKYSDGDMSCML